MLTQVLRQLAQVVADVPQEDLPRLAGALGEAHARVLARLVQPPTPPAAPRPTEDNVSVREAARRLGMSSAWVYKNVRSLPFTIRIGRRVLCSARGLERWNRTRLEG